MSGNVIVPGRTPTPGELRVGWRIPVILLVVDKCYGGSATWTQLHVLSWALLTRLSAKEVEHLLDGHSQGVIPSLIGIDPAVTLTVDRAVGERLLLRAKHRVSLTDAGRSVLDSVRATRSFEFERSVLDGLSKKITDQSTRDALRGWT